MKRGRGRPPLENGERLYLTIRVSEERKSRYERAAAKVKESLSAWVKRVLDRASLAGQAEGLSTECAEAMFAPIVLVSGDGVAVEPVAPC